MSDHAAPVTGLSREPAVVIGVITAFVAALIAALVAFGVDFTEEQRQAVLGMIGPTVFLILLVAFLIRRKVSPTSTVVARSTPEGDVVAGEASPIPTGIGVNVTTDVGPVPDAPLNPGGFIR